MKYSVFNQTANDATQEPMFFGQPVNVLRFDKQRYFTPTDTICHFTTAQVA